MFTRKVSDAGRITLPQELLTKFNIKQNDHLDISHNSEYILLKKHHPEFVCSITGKITNNGSKIGKAYVSKEGIELLKNFIEKQK